MEQHEPATLRLGRATIRVATAQRVAVVVGFPLLCALVLVRQPGVPMWDTVWAEDGSVFVSDANSGPVLATLLQGHAGYANVLPRLLAMPTAWLPASALAAYLAVAATCCNVALSMAAARLARPFVESFALRAVLVLLGTLGPLLYVETAGVVANVNWTLLWVMFWALVSTEDRPPLLALRTAPVFLGVVSTPLALLWFPVAGALAVLRRRRAEYLVLAGFAAATVLQLAVIATSEPDEGYPSHLGHLPPLWQVRVAGSYLVGERPLGSLWSHSPGVLLLGAPVVLALVVGALWWTSGRGPRKTIAAAAVGASVVLMAVPLWLRGTDPFRLVSEGYNPGGARYFQAPVLLLASAVVALAASRGRLVRAVVAVHAVVVIAISFTLSGQRSEGPPWSAQVRAARQACEVDPGGTPVLLVSPYGFALTLPCDRVAD